jgi:hypothetical protein
MRIELSYGAEKFQELYSIYPLTVVIYLLTVAIPKAIRQPRPVWKSPNFKGGEMRDPIELHPNTNGVAPP